MANTKITNHIVDSTVITGQTAVTVADGDYILVADASDSSALKKVLASDLIQSSEEVADIVGAMVSSNTESGITVAYEDSDNTIDFTIGTLNQNTTGSAATLTTARTIGGTSFDGSANIAVGLAATATALATSRTIHGVGFDGTANIDLSEVISDTVGAMFSSNTETNITVTYQDSDNTIDLVVDAAQPNVTSLGTLTTLDVDNINLNGNTIKSTDSDGDLIFQGNDGGSTITALTLDMSDAGKAYFNKGAVFNSDVVMNTAGNSENLALISTDADAHEGPILAMYRNSSSPADNDTLAQIYFQGENDADEKTNYALIEIKTSDVTNGTEDGTFNLQSMSAGTLRSKLKLNPTETVFNEDSVDLDFRVESNINTNSLVVSGETGNVGIGGVPVASADAYDTASLHIHQTQSGSHGSQIHLTNAATGAAAGNGAFISMWSDDDVYFTNQESDGNIIFASGGNSNVLVISDSGVVTSKTSANINQVALTSSSNAVAWDSAAAANAYHVTTENTTFSAPSNSVEGAIISVEIAQGGTARTIAWNTVFEFAASTAPTITATANKTDILAFRYNGSVWQEVGRVQNMAQT